jgi:hypothetical protein
MFVRNVSLRLKPNTLSEFTRIFDKEVIPMLRKQSVKSALFWSRSGPLIAQVLGLESEPYSGDWSRSTR